MSVGVISIAVELGPKNERRCGKIACVARLSRCWAGMLWLASASRKDCVTVNSVTGNAAAVARRARNRKSECMLWRARTTSGGGGGCAGVALGECVRY